MKNRKIIEREDAFEIAEFDGNAWHILGEFTALERAEQFLKEINKIITV